MLKNILNFVGILIVATLIYAAFGSSKGPTVQNSTISNIVTAISQSKIESVTVVGDTVTAKLKGQNTVLQADKETGVSIVQYGITPDKVALTVDNHQTSAVIVSMLPFILSVILLLVVGFFIYRQAQGGNSKAMSFSKTTARLSTSGKKVTFADVAGLRTTKHELEEVVEFLRTPQKFTKLGAELPRGVLLVGPSGVGKTLLAKAVAGEANVPFFNLSASEFVEMFVGVGAARVRDLFAKAKKVAPAVIFIDELDAVGRQRGVGMGGSHDEREQTLNQILVEMDGFETDARVIILAATNRPDVLDPALLRPGRFDRKVVLDLPDRDERQEILKIHMANKPLAKNVDTEIIARQTPGVSGADLKNIVNEAAIFAARQGKKEVTQGNLTEAIEKVLIGPERASHLMNVEERRIAAFHEAGHAIVGKAVKFGDPIHKISLVSRGTALGYTWSLPTEDRRMESKSHFDDQIAQLLAGRVAEEMIFNEVTTGASSDFKHATQIARDMVMVYGMSKLGTVSWGDRDDSYLGRGMETRNYSDEQAAAIDNEVKSIIETQKTRANNLLTKHRKLLRDVSERLLKEETLEGADFDDMFDGIDPDHRAMKSIRAMTGKKSKRSDPTAIVPMVTRRGRPPKTVA